MLKKVIRPNTAVIDAGGYFGFVSCMIAKHLHELGGGKLIIFEASPVVSHFLTHNIKKNISNRYDNVDVDLHVVTPLLDQKKTVSFPKPILTPDSWTPNHFGSAGIDNLYNTPEDGSWELLTTTIDALDIQDEISAFKVDVQGVGHEVLVGAKNTIARNNCGIVFEYEEVEGQKFTLQDTIAFLKNINSLYGIASKEKGDYLFTVNARHTIKY